MKHIQPQSDLGRDTVNRAAIAYAAGLLLGGVLAASNVVRAASSNCSAYFPEIWGIEAAAVAPEDARATWQERTGVSAHIDGGIALGLSSEKLNGWVFDPIEEP